MSGLTTQPVLNANGGVVNKLGATDSNANFADAQTLVDVNGVPIAPALDATVEASNALLTSLVTALGSTGLDYSGAGQPAIPHIGQPFANAGPYANYVLVTTVPASPTRARVDIENNCGTLIVVVRDDGTAASNTPPVNASVFPIDPGVPAQQGNSWTSTTFKGRLQVYCATAPVQVCVMVD